MPHRKSVVSLPLEKLLSGGSLSVDCLKLPPSYVAGDRKEKYHTGGEKGLVNFSRASGEFMKNNQKAFPNLYRQAVSYSIATNKTNANGTQYGNGFFSSSLSEVFGKKCKLFNLQFEQNLCTQTLFHSINGKIYFVYSIMLQYVVLD